MQDFLLPWGTMWRYMTWIFPHMVKAYVFPFHLSIYQVMLEELAAIVDGTKCRCDSYLVTVIPVVQHSLFVVIDLQDAEDHKGYTYQHERYIQ